MLKKHSIKMRLLFRMLFRMVVSKYTLNNKSFKQLERTIFKGLLLVSFAFIDLAWHIRTVIVHNNAEKNGQSSPMKECFRTFL